MSWKVAIEVFLSKYCTAQGLRSSTLAAYQRSLRQFQEWLVLKYAATGRTPREVSTQDVLDYVEHLRKSQKADATVNSRIVTLRAFYRALVAIDLLTPRQNPTALLPRIKAPKRRVPDILSPKEIEKLVSGPRADTVLGLRDRAILALLYGTGIRASECALLKEVDVDCAGRTVRVLGKGGHERSVPLNDIVIRALRQYADARGAAPANQPFFQTRKRRGATRGVVYERVRHFAKRVGLRKKVTPHVLRHTFATHLVRLGEKLVVIKELLGHRAISSTQVYLHLNGEDLRKAIDKHPIGQLAHSLADVLPIGKLRFQWPHGTQFAFNSD